MFFFLIKNKNTRGNLAEKCLRATLVLYCTYFVFNCMKYKLYLFI